MNEDNKNLLGTISAAVGMYCSINGQAAWATLSTFVPFLLSKSTVKDGLDHQTMLALSKAKDAFEHSWMVSTTQVGDVASAALTFQEHYCNGDKNNLPGLEVVMATGRNPDDLAKVMLNSAADSNPDCYSDKPINKKNRDFLLAVFKKTYEELFDSLLYNEKAQGEFQTACLKSLTAIDESQKDIQDTLAEISDKLDKNKQDESSADLAPNYQELAEKLGVAKHLIEHFLNRVKREKIPEDKWASTLDEHVKEYKELVDTVNSLGEDETQLSELDLKTQRHINDGDFAKAEDALEEAASIDVENINQATEHLDEKKQQASKRREVMAQSAKLNGNFAKAASWYRSAAAILPDADKEQVNLLRLHALVLHRWLVDGNGDAKAYDAGVSIGKTILDEVSQKEMPKLWADTRVELASIHLAMHVIHRDDSKRIEKASALLEGSEFFYDRDSAPKEWSAAQNTHGVVWLELARESPTAKDYDVAIQHYGALLKKISPVDDFLGFVEVKINLGNTLLEYGTRQPDVQSLSEAILHHEAVLPMLSRHPRYSYALLGDISFAQSTIADIMNAATAAEMSYRVSLLNNSIQNAQKAMAMAELIPNITMFELTNTKNMLCIAKYRRGSVTQNEKDVREAIALAEECTSVWSAEKLPDRWAALQQNLGAMHGALARILGENRFYADAAQHYKACLDGGAKENRGAEFLMSVQDYTNAILRSPMSNTLDYESAKKYVNRVLKTRGISEVQAKRFNALSEQLDEGLGVPS